jgi:hypothetical protein
MSAEKVAAPAEAQATTARKGRNGAPIVKKVSNTYEKKVRANERRLSR